MSARTVVSLWPLFFGLSLVGLAAGVQGTLLGYRAEVEGFDDALIGLLMSAYFAGFLLGSVFAPRLIDRVGHIRTFAAVSALASVTILVHASFVEPWTWSVMRLITGFAFSCIYVVTESWLNEAATNETRGQILSVYMLILLGGTCAGQFMLTVADPAGLALFVLVSVMISVAAMPILMTVMRTPALETSERVSVLHLWRRAKMGVIGLVLIQWCSSMMYGMGAVYAAKMALGAREVALFMGAIMGGAMLMQWPLGHVSDRVDRRWVMGGASLIAVGAGVYASTQTQAGWPLYLSALVFGGFTLSQYSLVVSSIHDHLRPSEMTPASGTIVMLSGAVCISGPLTVSFSLQWFGLQSFFLLMSGILLLMAVISLYRVIMIPALPPEYKTHAVLQLPVSPVGSVLHPEEKDVVEHPGRAA
ncbi:MAG: MFS transporter [Chromatocurvus sp.]